MSHKKKTIAVIGATGAVGREIVRLLIERKFPFHTLKLFASEKSVGEELYSYKIEKLHSLEGIDLAFFAAGSAVSKEWIPKAGCICIDSSSFARDHYPLIIPEINPEAMLGNVFASPNCAATILLMPLFPLHQQFSVKRIVLSTYQAASGAGWRVSKHLQEESLAHLEKREFPPLFPFPYAFNLFPHDSPLLESGYVEEEIKIKNETKKILRNNSIQISSTCVRVPVLRAHSISINVEFNQPFTLHDVYQSLEKMPGVQIFEDRSKNRFATPFDVSGQEDVFCGRFRIDESQPNTLEFWVVGDQLLKGAALNAVQIAETTN